MKKWLLLLCVAAAVLLLVLMPPVVGVVAHKQILQLIAEVNEGSHYQIELADYHRGWWQSDVQLNFTLPDGEDHHSPHHGHDHHNHQPHIDHPSSLQLDGVVSHGPLLFGSQPALGVVAFDMQFALPEVLQLSELADLLSGEGILHYRFIKHFSGKQSFELRSPQLALSSQSGVEEGATDRVAGTELIIAGSTRPPVDGKGNLSIAITAAELSVRGHHATDVQFAIQLDDIDRDALLQLYPYLWVWIETDFRGGWQQLTATEPARAALQKLLSASPRIELPVLRLNYQNELAQMSGFVTADYPQVFLPAAASALQPDTLMPYLTVEAKVETGDTLSKQLVIAWLTDKMSHSRMGKYLSRPTLRQMAVGQAGTFLVLQQQQGYLVKTETGYGADFSLVNGQRYLNGEPYPFRKPSLSDQEKAD